jgi:hypothetical protein
MNKEKVTLTIADENGASIRVAITEDSDEDMDMFVKINSQADKRLSENNSLYSAICNSIFNSFGEPIEIQKL